MVTNGYNGLRKNGMRSRLAAPHTCGEYLLVPILKYVKMQIIFYVL